MITPVNGHLLINPLKHDSFIASQKGIFEEIGIVLAIAPPTRIIITPTEGFDVKVGDRVYFDSWLIARYPDGKGGELWLVKWEDVRAIEHAEN